MGGPPAASRSEAVAEASAAFARAAARDELADGVEHTLRRCAGRLGRTLAIEGSNPLERKPAFIFVRADGGKQDGSRDFFEVEEKQQNLKN